MIWRAEDQKQETLIIGKKLTGHKIAWEWKRAASYGEDEIEEMMESLAKGRSLGWEQVDEKKMGSF